MNVELLKELTEAHGTSGYEDEIRAIVRRELEGTCEISSDAMGNLICLKRGNGKRKLMLAAHMDEIGFVVRHIEDKGFLRLATLGGWDPRQMNSQRVVVRTKEGRLPGVLMYGTKPAHLLSDAEKNEGQKHDNFFVDLGLPVEDVKARVRIGDSVTMDRSFLKLGNLFTCKSMDDRVAVFVMIEALKVVGKHEADVYAVATVQEEIGLRGAAAAGWSVQPDVAVAIDITLANDIPGIGGPDEITRLGEGTAIKVLDSSLICHPKVVEHFRSLAEQHSIPHQMEILTRGGTDAGAIQRLHGGIPSFTLSIPTRYVHTVNETVHERDVQASIGEADWDLIGRLREAVSVPLIGNGDVKKPEDAVRMLRETGCDGVMVGRAAISNPWMLRDIRRALDGLPPGPAPTLGDRIRTAIDHLHLMVAYECGVETYAEALEHPDHINAEVRACRALRGQIPLYIKGEHGASHLRDQLTRCSTVAEYQDLLDGFAARR